LSTTPTFASGAALLAALALAASLAAARSPATAAPTRPGLSFVVFGDNQFATTSCTSGVPERMAIPAVITALAPDLVLHTGDLMDHGWEPGAYLRFARCYQGMLARAPLFPTLGNHDAAAQAHRAYKRYLQRQLLVANPAVMGAAARRGFALYYADDPSPYSNTFRRPSHRDEVPSGVTFKTYYAFRTQNAYFISFEQGTRWWSNTPLPWVERQLKLARADAAIKHVVVFMHHPMYSTTMDERSRSGCVEPVRRLYEPLFRRYDVTLVFSGHAHLYDRFYVPDDDRKTRPRRGARPRRYPHDGKGIHYIVTGGGGGPLKHCKILKKERSHRYAQRRACVHHVTQVKIRGNQLEVSAVRVRGSAQRHQTKVIDRFVIR
jgi:3',5'-cyclic AMP phosphodiesterase CpdA